MTKQLKEIEIPFGAKDSELYGWEYTIPEGMEATIVDNKIVVKKKESEDERIRKNCIHFLELQKSHHASTIEIEEYIAWIKKQGEQKLVNTDLDELVIQLEETIGTSPHSRETIKDFFQKAVQKYMNCLRIATGEIGALVEENYRLKEKQGEQNPYSGVSFKYNGHTFGMCARDGGVEILMDRKLKAFVSLDKSFIYSIRPLIYPIHPQSSREAIKEEKVDNANKVEPKFHEGDWVVFNGLRLFIKEVVQGYYRTISVDGIPNSYDWDIDNLARLWTIQDAKPGDVLVWDDSKCIALFKNVYDKDNFNSYGFVGHCTGKFEVRANYHGIEGAHPATKEQRDLLFQKMHEEGYEWDADKKELKKIEQNSVWSEEDTINLTNTIRALQSLGMIQEADHRYDNLINWLKFLIERYNWKPSDKQLEAFEHFVRSWGESGISSPYNNYIKLIYSLLQDLKRLREE